MSKLKIFLGINIAATSLLCLLLLLRIPLLQALPGWAWEFTDKPFNSFWILGGAIPVYCLLAYAIIKQKISHGIALPLIILSGMIMQWGMAATEGKGMAAVEDRLVSTGHAEFVELAISNDDIPYLVANYEDLVKQGKLGEFGPSKPPGTLVFHVLTYRVSELLHPSRTTEAAASDFRSTAAWLWPLLSCLAIIPLYFLGLSLYGKEQAIAASALLVTIPSFTLVNLHTDQAIYPFFFLSCLAVAQLAGKKDSWRWGLVGGVLAFFAVGLSFGLMVAAIFMFVFCRNSTRALLGISAGALLCMAAADVWLDYSIWERFVSAIKYHQDWRPWPSAWWAYGYFGFLNFLEFTVWLSVPLAAWGTFGVVDSLRSPDARMTPPWLFHASLVAVLLFLGIFTKTQGETARLWIFLTPLFCLTAGAKLLSLPPGERTSYFILTIVVQVGIAVLIKSSMDFA